MTKASTKLGDLLDEIYEGYAQSGAGDIGFFEPYCDRVMRFDPSEVVAQQVKAYPLLYVTNFLLSCPNLLSVMNTNAWARALVAAGPRPELRPSEIQMEQQSDIYFICKFLRLNAVRFAIDCKLIPLADKQKILRKAQMNTPLLVLQDIDREDLDGIHFISETFLRKITDQLYAEGGWSRLPNTHEGIIESLQLP